MASSLQRLLLRTPSFLHHSTRCPATTTTLFKLSGTLLPSSSPTTITPLASQLALPALTVVPQRYKTHHTRHSKLPTKRLKNPFVQRHTDFIKLLCIALIKYERILTTCERAKILEKYCNLLIEMTRRKVPPPDINIAFRNGFMIRPDEITERFTVRTLLNRRWKKRVMMPAPLSEEQYVEACRQTVGQILLQDEEAIAKLYGELHDRYYGKYGGFVKITSIPNGENGKKYPTLAYVEFFGNDLGALPAFPFVNRHGMRFGQPREYSSAELEEEKERVEGEGRRYVPMVDDVEDEIDDDLADLDALDAKLNATK